MAVMSQRVLPFRLFVMLEVCYLLVLVINSSFDGDFDTNYVALLFSGLVTTVFDGIYNYLQL